MFNLLLEGFASLRFGCTVGFVLPLVGPALAAGRRAWLAPLTLVLLAGSVGWARFADRWFNTPATEVLTALAAATVIAAVLGVRQAVRPTGDDARAAASWRLTGAFWTAAALVPAALVAGWLWVPCVGEHFSEPLNNAQQHPFRTWIEVLSYVVGIAMPLIALVAIPVAFPSLVRVRDSIVTRGFGLLLSAVVGVAIAAGWYSELVVRFAP